MSFKKRFTVAIGFLALFSAAPLRADEQEAQLGAAVARYFAPYVDIKEAVALAVEAGAAAVYVSGPALVELAIQMAKGEKGPSVTSALPMDLLFADPKKKLYEDRIATIVSEKSPNIEEYYDTHGGNLGTDIEAHLVPIFALRIDLAADGELVYLADADLKATLAGQVVARERLAAHAAAVGAGKDEDDGPMSGIEGGIQLVETLALLRAAGLLPGDAHALAAGIYEEWLIYEEVTVAYLTELDEFLRLVKGQNAVYQALIEMQVPVINGKHLTPPLALRKFASTMVSVDQDPAGKLWVSLLTGALAQVNHMPNPFIPYIGKPLRAVPKKILAAAGLVDFTFYHRTKTAEQRRRILQGETFASFTDNPNTGTASWGDGLYVATSPALIQYGLDLVIVRMNEDAVIGEQIDIFVGEQDGFIGVIKDAAAMTYVEYPDPRSAYDLAARYYKDYRPDVAINLLMHLEKFEEDKWRAAFAGLEISPLMHLFLVAKSANQAWRDAEIAKLRPALAAWAQRPELMTVAETAALKILDWQVYAGAIPELLQLRIVLQDRTQVAHRPPGIESIDKALKVVSESMGGYSPLTEIHTRHLRSSLRILPQRIFTQADDPFARLWAIREALNAYDRVRALISQGQMPAAEADAVFKSLVASMGNLRRRIFLWMHRDPEGLAHGLASLFIETRGVTQVANKMLGTIGLTQRRRQIQIETYFTSPRMEPLQSLVHERDPAAHTALNDILSLRKVFVAFADPQNRTLHLQMVNQSVAEDLPLKPLFTAVADAAAIADGVKPGTPRAARERATAAVDTMPPAAMAAVARVALGDFMRRRRSDQTRILKTAPRPFSAALGAEARIRAAYKSPCEGGFQR